MTGAVSPGLVVRGGQRRRRETRIAYGFLSLPLLLFLVLLAVPLLATLVLSLYEWNLFTPPRFVGLDNYARMLEQPSVGRAFLNTAVFTVAAVVLHIVAALALALGVRAIVSKFAQYVVRTTIFFPMLISGAAASMIWLYMIDPNYGFLNYYLERLGAQNVPNWLLEPQYALGVLVIYDLWKTLGFAFVVMLAGLQGVPAHLYEAARIDGAGAWRRFTSVTLPLISPTLLFVSIFSMTGAFQVFEPMFIITQGGPGDSTLSIVQLVYYTAFRDFQIGLGSAVSVVIAVVIALVSVAQFVLSRRWVHYERV